MSLKFLKGAFKSRTIWWNVLLAFLGSLELFGSHLTTLFGTQVAAVVLLVGGAANLVLRAITTQALSEK